MAKRKTIDVEKIIDWANMQMARPEMSQEFKRGVFSLTDQILHDTGNYLGFNYLGWISEGCDKWIADGRPSGISKYLGLEYDRYFYKS